MKLRNHGITWKIFVYLLVFVAVMVLAITLAQGYALEKSYENDRIESVRRLAQTILEQYDNKDLESMLDDVAMHEDSCIHILNAEGETLLASKRFRNCMIHRMPQEKIGAFLQEVNASPPSGERSPKPQEFAPEGIQNKKLSDMPQRPFGVGRVALESLAYAVRGEDAQGSDFYVLIGTTITPLNSTAQVLREQMLVVVVFLVVAAAGLAWLMARSIAKPIIDINESAKELTQHNYDVTFDTAGYREIAELRDTLNEAAAELNKTEKLRRELMANISHDLRTPLTMIIGYGEVMRDLPGENTPENVQVIIDEANRLNLLVEDVLDLSKLEASVDEMVFGPVNLTQAVEDMVQRCARMTEKDGYRISFQAAEDVWVQGDELRLSQVVYNLIGNALTHTGADRLVRVEQRVEKDYVQIGFSDSGQGIAPDRLKDIWQRYYKVDKVHRRSRVGTGLGLSIVKDIVEKHGGECGVESSEGKGSTFWFRLPLKRD